MPGVESTSRPWQTRPRRFPVQIPISLATVDVFLDSEIMNLSKGGIFIRADLTLPLGTEVDFKFTVPGSDRVIETHGVVVWTRKGHAKHAPSFPDHPCGMGIQFKDTPMVDIERILDAIEALTEKANDNSRLT